MSLSLYRRHTSKCSQGRSRHERTYESDELRRGFKKCNCPIQFEGKVKGVGFLRKSTEKISWDEAKVAAAGWETAAISQPAQLPQPPVSESASVARNNNEPVTIERAVKEFLADIEARKMDDSTRRKYRTMLKQLRAYAAERGFLYLNHFSVEALTAFRGTWKDELRSGAKKLERVRGFFRFAHEREWVPKNPASKLKPPVGSSKPANKHPFSDDEIKMLFEACPQYKSHRWSNGISEGEVTGDQIQTFMMLLIYTGLRISDAATFSTDKLQGNNAFLFMHKTNEPVFTWIPGDLVARLKSLPLQRGKYYFMGPVTERKETAADMWRRKLGDIFDMAGPWKIKPTPHRFRHTFARLLLQRGVPVDDVATLMGHSDPKITLKHYGHWVPERQERLTDILKSAWQPKSRSKLTLIKAGAK
jgi:integrase/recombinase XerD